MGVLRNHSQTQARRHRDGHHSIDSRMYTLYIGNKNSSSWSLRAWVLMRTFDVPFKEVHISLDEPDTPTRIRARSPSGRVPVLYDDETVVWDSLAIAEYLAERHPRLWPEDPVSRAWARCASAEMHSGFAALRNDFEMNVRLRVTRTPSGAAVADVARICELWREGRRRFAHHGALLCGQFSIVDAFFCPVAFRFASYGIALGPVEEAYKQALLALPAMREWAAAAGDERERSPKFDAPVQAQQ
jgi:glutathione S-transferase